MSVIPARQPIPAPPAQSKPTGSSAFWIINSWWDAVFFLWTPLLLAPLILLLHSPYVGVETETIALIVVAFGALGHHFPGMLRAYGDRELFERFRLRFILAPILLFCVFFPLYYRHYGAMKLILTLWACWHGFMQIYGFVRIYDAKVGCVSPVTAYWDWLMCLCWCSTAQIFSHEKVSLLMEHWYMLGGPLIPPSVVHASRWICLAGSCAVLIGFLINHVRQTRLGPAPNPAKLMMLASGIGFWWICMVGVENIILGTALFELFHDVQYLTIVWMYNCRRVTSSTGTGAFMKFVFRRGMLPLYIGLVLAYGVIGLGPAFAQNEALNATFAGILWTSTILHYYYDGFIWKVREKSTQDSLGLTQRKPSGRIPQVTQSGLIHLLKWSPLIALLSCLFLSDWSLSPTLSQERKKEIAEKYTRTLAGSSTLPDKVDEQAWLYSEFQHVQNIAEANPRDLSTQVRAAIMRANFGQNDQAVEMLHKLLSKNPTCASAHLALGQIDLYRGDIDRAMARFQDALKYAGTKDERSNALLKIGEVYWRRKEPDLAQDNFNEAVKENPKVQSAIDAFKQLPASP